MGCGCRNNNSGSTNRGTSGSNDLSRFAYLTPRQLRLKKEQEVNNVPTTSGEEDKGDM